MSWLKNADLVIVDVSAIRNLGVTENQSALTVDSDHQFIQADERNPSRSLTAEQMNTNLQPIDGNWIVQKCSLAELQIDDAETK